jgi:hypothetical protein
MSGSNDRAATEHQQTTTGGSSGRNAETEHRDLARPEENGPNELRPDERGREEGIGPRTHDDTRFTRKEGARDR